MSPIKMTPINAVYFLREAAKYFAALPTHGEDRAYWANIYNSENCNDIADLIEANLINISVPTTQEINHERTIRSTSTSNSNISS